MLKGQTSPQTHPLNWHSLSRTSWTQPEGGVGAFMHEAIVYNVNLVNWTVDVYTKFDQRTMMDIQVGSPYMHPFSGEGIYAVPEVGSKCVVAIPSDGPPPFVLCFIMPMETMPDNVTEETPEGTAGTGGKNDFNFGGGRSRGKPGDIVAKGRDGNFMILHRGGVAQFGASPLAQRICVPLNNLVTDISQTFNHFNGGGSINWGVQDRGSQSPTAEYRHTQRIFANDAYADIRVDMGRVRTPVPEPVGDKGETGNITALGIKEKDVVFEFVLAKDGFETDSGEFKGKADDVRLRVIFDRDGSGMFRFEGSLDIRIKKQLRLTVDENVQIICKKNVSITADGKVDIIGGSKVSVGTKGGVVALNGGNKPVAHVGSLVEVVIGPAPLQAMAIIPPAPAPVPITIAPGAILRGTVSSGVGITLV